MRPLQLISTAGFYGAECMVLNLMTALRGLGASPVLGLFDNLGYSNLELGDRARERGLDVGIIPCNGKIDRQCAAHILGAVERHGINVIHTHGPKPNVYALAATWRNPIPLVATYHIDWPDRDPLLYAYHVLGRLLLHRFARIAGVSPQIAGSLHKAGILSSKLTVVNNGIDVAPFFNATPASEFAHLPRPRVGVIGRLTPQKGQRYLLEAIPAIVRRRPEARFLFAGTGPDRTDLEQTTARLGIGGNVMFVGQQTNMPAMYAALDLFVLPSVNEGMPMAILESMAASCPVIATQVGAVDRLIEDGVTGVLVRPRDPAALEQAICNVLGDPSFAQQLREQARDRVLRSFSSRSMAERFLEIYEDVTARRGEVRAQTAAGGNRL